MFFSPHKQREHRQIRNRIPAEHLLQPWSTLESSRERIQNTKSKLWIKVNHPRFTVHSTVSDKKGFLSETVEFVWASELVHGTNIQRDGGNLYITKGVCSGVCANWVSASSSSSLQSLQLKGHSWHTFGLCALQPLCLLSGQELPDLVLISKRLWLKQ